ncbi:MAG: Uma2 family endonuclease [Cyanobacteria bacterium J06598_1]
MTVAAAKWSLEEYHQMIDSGVLSDRRVELIRGDIVEMAPEGKPHAYFSTVSSNYLVKALSDRALVRQAHPITLPNGSEPEPDVAIVKPLGVEYLKHHPYPEEIFWLMEYSDAALAKDLNLKSSVYAEVNISEYWVINLKQRSLIVFRHPQSGQYTSQTAYTDGFVSPIAFPDLSIPVNQIVSKAC